MTSKETKFIFSLAEKEFLLSLLAYTHERIEQKQELNAEVIFFDIESRKYYLDLILNISKKVMLMHININDLDREQVQKYFMSELTKDDIRKILKGR